MNPKRGPDRSSANKYLSFGAKIAKIGPADPEIICLWAIIKKEKEEINASKIYSSVGNLAERAKLWKVKYIARLASLPSGLNKMINTGNIRIYDFWAQIHGTGHSKWGFEIKCLIYNVLLIICYLRSWQRGTLPALIQPLRLNVYVPRPHPLPSRCGHNINTYSGELNGATSVSQIYTRWFIITGTLGFYYYYCIAFEESDSKW